MKFCKLLLYFFEVLFLILLLNICERVSYQNVPKIKKQILQGSAGILG